MSRARKPRARPWPPEVGDGWPVPTVEEIAAARLPSGFYDVDKLREWGIPLKLNSRNKWAPPDGWRPRMESLWRLTEKKRERASRPWPPEERDGWPLPSPEEIEAAKGANGYWPRDVLEQWGVPQNPVPDRWKETLERAYWRENIPPEIRELLGEAYDDEGIEIAWRNPWRGMKRWRMFEMWWEDPDQVRAALRPPTSLIELRHIDGAGRIELKLPMDPKLAAAVLEALGPLGWNAMSDVTVLFDGRT